MSVDKRYYRGFVMSEISKGTGEPWHCSTKELNSVVFGEMLRKTKRTLRIAIKNPNKMLEYSDDLWSDIRKVFENADIDVRIITYKKKSHKNMLINQLIYCERLCNNIEHVNVDEWRLNNEFIVLFDDNKSIMMYSKKHKSIQWCSGDENGNDKNFDEIFNGLKDGKNEET